MESCSPCSLARQGVRLRGQIRCLVPRKARAPAPDGRVLATAAGYDQRTIQLWDTESGKQFRTLEGHSDFVTDLVFSNDGLTLASASSDETVRLWDTRTWSESAPALCGNGDEVEA